MNLGACQYETLAWPAMRAADRAAWDRIRGLRPTLRGPYFTLDWCDQVQAARGDLEVVRITRGEALVGFLPFHRGRFGALRPAAGPLSDVHGFIAEADAVIDAPGLVAALGASAFRFTAAPPDDPGLGPCGRAGEGYGIGLDDGYDAYVLARSKARPKAFRNLRARLRKIEEAGLALEFRGDDRSADTLDAIIALKRLQYRRTRQIDVFGPPWTGRLLHNLVGLEGEGLRGRLTSLWLGGRLAAGHFGLQAEGVLHYWFTAYDEAFAAFSPGVVLLHRLAAAAAAEGVTRIDLGGGDYRFKHEFADLRPPVVGGVVRGRGLLAGAVSGADAAARRFSRLPLGSAASLPSRALSRLDRLIAFHEVRPPAA